MQTGDRVAALDENSPAVSSASDPPAVDDSEIEQIKAALEKTTQDVSGDRAGRRAQGERRGQRVVSGVCARHTHLRDTLAKSDNVKILREVCREDYRPRPRRAVCDY